MSVGGVKSLRHKRLVSRETRISRMLFQCFLKLRRCVAPGVSCWPSHSPKSWQQTITDRQLPILPASVDTWQEFLYTYYFVSNGGGGVIGTFYIKTLLSIFYSYAFSFFLLICYGKFPYEPVYPSVGRSTCLPESQAVQDPSSRSPSQHSSSKNKQITGVSHLFRDMQASKDISTDFPTR